MCLNNEEPEYDTKNRKKIQSVEILLEEIKIFIYHLLQRDLCVMFYLD